MTNYRSAVATLVALLCPCTRALSAVTPEFLVGVCTHFGDSKVDLARNLKLIKEAGATSIRDDIHWAEIEHQQGIYAMPPTYERFVDQSVQAGLAPLLILDYGNPLYDKGDKPTSPQGIEGFARYAEFVARHFKGRVHVYELFNEWDGRVGHTSSGQPESYISLIKVVTPRIKQVDNSIVVIGPAVTSGGITNGWFESFLAEGGTKWLDGVSLHPYSYYMGKANRTPARCIERIADYEAMIKKYSGGKTIPIYVTEVGYPTYNGKVSTATDLSAAYLGQLYLLARTLPFLKGIWWYDFKDDGFDKNEIEQSFGLVTADLTPKPGFFELKEISGTSTSASSAARIDVSDSDLTVLRLKLPNGSQRAALWRNTESTTQLPIAADVSNRLASMFQQSSSDKPGEPSSSTLLQIGAKPILVTSRGAN